ncbi:DUF4422 domain-containing protein [Clostridium felsineum]|uniref:Uncharacterized protein n=1 Tax=Clostridium felsineum TaxID=36839 RepID=A0A1S8LWF1_9CLOT|nr:DUF4422 domain-containing protein [Clostridium felsineum]URZ08148.1 hypothetical protein CLROS_035140 [Clostridium felsineum]URZ13179.1 hypothetical protein CROST_039290 [Clostridium felsineum]
MNSKVFVCFHKKYVVPKSQIYVPINVGSNNNELNIISDNLGKNISDKNNNYCELTALYWIWKNANLNKYVGLCHYRRYFDFKDMNDSKISKHISGLNVFHELIDNVNSEKKIEDIFNSGYDIILPMRRVYPVSVKQQYLIKHRISDWKILNEILEKNYPSYFKASKRIWNENNKAHLYNMFITKKEIFYDYMNFIFNVLSKVEKRIVISDNKYQARVFGFMAERMLNLYVYCNKLKVKEVPIIYFDDKFDGITSNRKQQYFDKISDIIFKFQKII